MIRLATIAAAALVAASAASAEPKPDTSRGTLTKSNGDVVIMFGEGICTFDDAADAKKIMAVCRIGQHCEVTGLIEDCKDSGECVAVSHVTDVTTGRTRR